LHQILNFTGLYLDPAGGTYNTLPGLPDPLLVGSSLAAPFPRTLLPALGLLASDFGPSGRSFVPFVTYIPHMLMDETLITGSSIDGR